MAIHTVIFDMDGTLSDTAVLTFNSLKRLAPKYGLPVPSRQEIQKVMGYANPEFYYRLFPGIPRDALDDLSPVLAGGEMDELASIKEKVLFEGSVELLESLKKKGVRMHIASTGSKKHVHSVTSVTGIAVFFETISCGVPDKTETVREIIGNEDKNGFVYLGDMVKDYIAARENGILSVGACYGYCSRESSEFDLYIGHPVELLDILDFEPAFYIK